MRKTAWPPGLEGMGGGEAQGRYLTSHWWAQPAGQPRTQRSGFQGDAGLIIASCERGDIRQSFGGIYVYDDDGMHDEPTGDESGGRRGELEEMHAAINENRPVPQTAGGGWRPWR